MATLTIVEALDKHGCVQHRHFVDNLPFNIGRAYDNDLVLDDDFVCPKHAQIDLDAQGNLVVMDLNSKNGLFLFKNSKKLGVSPINDADDVRIGHTRMRFRKPNFQVPQALKDTLHDYWLSNLMHQTGLLMGIWGAMLSVIVCDNMLEYYHPYSMAELAGGLMNEGLIVLGWASAWVVINRLTTHATHLGAHFLITFMGYTSFILLTNLSHYLSFSFSLAGSIYLFDHAIEFLVLFGMLYGHMRYCSFAPASRVLWMVNAMAFSIVGLIGLSDALKAPYADNVDLSVRLKPPMFNVVVGDRLDTFFSDSAELKRQVDEQIKTSSTQMGFGQ